MHKNFIFASKNFIVRWLKFIIIFIFLLISLYMGIIYISDEKKVFVVEKEISYSIEKIFPQFNNPQNFMRWNSLFLSDGKYIYNYFLPYQGEGSSVSFSHIKDRADNGQIFIRYVNPDRTIKYEIYKGKSSTPYKVNVKFVSKGEITKIVWQVETPKISLKDRFTNQNIEEEIRDNIGKSMGVLSNILSGKVDKEVMMGQIEYDNILIEEQGEKLLLGLNVSTNNQSGNLLRNININHNKIIDFVTKNLSKREDEYGFPIVLTEVGELKNKEISYFYGLPLSKQEKIEDNNFVFRKLNKSKVYTIYYKGKYEYRIKTIEKLLKKIKDDSLRNGILEEMFLKYPKENEDVIIKISLPVFK